MFVSGGLAEVEGASIPPQPSDVQNWYALAADDPDVAELLRHFGEDPNFYELFKVYKAIEVLSSRLEGGLEARPWAPSDKKLERFTRTADYYHRHSLARAKSQKKVPPKKAMPLQEATQLISYMVTSLLDELAHERAKSLLKIPGGQ